MCLSSTLGAERERDGGYVLAVGELKPILGVCVCSGLLDWRWQR